MKSIRSFKSALAVLAATCALCVASVAHADLTYQVDVNTSALVNNASGPFYVDFQSIFGSGLPQTVTVSNFSLAGGSLLGSGTATGAVSGSLAGSLVLNPSSSSFFNEYYQAFSSTVNDIKFNLNLSTNASGVTPSSFVFALLDKDLFNIPTNGLGDSLIFADINGRSTTLQTFSGLGVTVSVTPVPEPSTYGIIAGVMAITGIVLRRRRGNKANA